MKRTITVLQDDIDNGKRTITALQDDIDNGQCSEAYNCAIALAAIRDLADLLPENGCVGVAHALTLYRRRQRADGYVFAGLHMFMSASLPAEARDFIRYFDHLDACQCGMPLPQPFKFEIDLKPFAESAQGETQQ